MSDLENDPDMPAIAPPSDEPGSSPSNPIIDDAPVYHRVVGENTRKLFSKAAESLKQQLDAEDGDEEVAIKPPDEQPAAAAGAVAPAAQGTQAAPTHASPAAAAPAPDAAASRAALQLEVREKSLTEREAKLAEREKQLAPHRERYVDKPALTIRDLVKEWTGAETDDEVKDEVADLITELSDSVLGLPVSAELKNRTESRRAIRQVKSYKADLSRREQALADERAAAEQKQREAAAAAAIGERLRAAAADKYPHLMAEDEPHAIVWDVIKTKASREPEWQPNWEEAATLANEHFKKVHQGQHQKLSRLFTPAATAAPAQAAQHQGAPQSRGARTLTNAVAAPVTTAPVEPELEGEYDRHAARRKSLGRLQAAIKERTT